MAKRFRVSQPRLKDERRAALLACLHPILAAMVQMDATAGPGNPVSVGWIINDAIARYYNQPDLASTAIYRERIATRPRRRRLEP